MLRMYLLQIWFNLSAPAVRPAFTPGLARLIMYNFSELITSSVVIQKANRKYAYKAIFSVAAHICRQFFLENISQPDVETLIARFISPIRPGRSRPRNVTVKKSGEFHL